MRTFSDAKVMAKALRQGLSERNIDLTHGDCLELVALQFGLSDWNTLAAAIEQKQARMPLEVPDGWLVSGAGNEDYEMGVEDDNRRGEAVIRCRYASGDPAFKANGFGTLMQSIQADTYRGKRLMLSAELKTENVDAAATIWMRVDGIDSRALRFDNMETRSSAGPLKGTNDWTGRRIVLDVPDEAQSIHYGFYLRGGGVVRVRNFDVSEVSGDTPVTAGSKPERTAPTNLGFSKRLAT